jgi:DNA-binding transcriptional MerR regulator
MTQRQSQDNVLEKPGTNLLSIREFARICRVTPRTIRFYDQKDLLKPKYIDEWTKYRYYDPLQVRDFLMIKFMQNFHIPLSQIKLNLQIKSNDLYLKERLDDLKKEIEERRREINFLEKIHLLFFEDKNVKNMFKKEEIGPFQLFGLKFENTSYDLINKHREEVRLEAKKLGIKSNQDLVIYLDSKFKPKNTAIEVYVICKKENLKIVSLPEKYIFKSFPRIKALTYEYSGPELYFIIVYQRLFYLLGKLKVSIKNNNFDIYESSLGHGNSVYDFEAKLIFPI